jgi:hypothetical protein
VPARLAEGAPRGVAAPRSGVRMLRQSRLRRLDVLGLGAEAHKPVGAFHIHLAAAAEGNRPGREVGRDLLDFADLTEQGGARPGRKLAHGTRCCAPPHLPRRTALWSTAPRTLRISGRCSARSTCTSPATSACLARAR